eukprot:c10500_g1_i1.p1 GENE.c10500_g1_i1~~c10500_g1_i1.p1  ORF type:complete len:420 (-),score=125.75 c10500_g1_i1:480-1649(-)
MDSVKGFMAWLFSKADRDGDGKITFADAKKGMLEYFDRDGDGKITIDEIEGGTKTAIDWIETTTEKIKIFLAPFEGAILFAFGGFVCYYGKNFNYTILFAQAFRVTGWPVVKKAYLELKQTYNESRIVLKKEMPVLVDETDSSLRNRLANAEKALAAEVTKGKEGDAVKLHKLQQDVNKAQLALAASAASSFEIFRKCVDPTRLSEIVKGVYTGCAACFATALSNGAAKIGIGLNVGNVISSSVNNTVRPILRQLLDKLMASNASLSQIQHDANYDTWVAMIINGLCNSVGVGLAYYFERTMFTVSNALTGAEIMTQQLVRFASAKGVPMQDSPIAMLMLYGLCASGVYSQVVRGRGELPLIAKGFLFVPLMFEKYLSAAAAAARASLL